MTKADVSRRAVARARTKAYRDRRRHGRVVALVEVSLQQLAALERLTLLDANEWDKARIGRAVSRFLNAADHVSVMGDALWPEAEHAEQDG